MIQRTVFGKRNSEEQAMLLPGETVIYGRRSKQGESAFKSLDDQVAVSLEVCADYNIPVSEEDVWLEEPGHGGDEWYSGVILYVGQEHDGTPPTTRPILTKIVNGILSGNIKCVVIFSQCRLWRSVAICSALIDLFAKHNVLFYDRNGQVDISTPEGRNNVLQNAVSAQNMRENAVVNCARGVTRSRNKGKLVCYPNVLGFRGVGGRTGKVIVVPDEMETVRRIFRMFDAGENESGPMNAYQIAKKLTAEKFEHAEDLQAKRHFKRHEDSKHVVYSEYVRHLLRDVRYIAFQPHEGEIWPCDAFLVDGEPAISPALFERVQKKLQSVKTVRKAGVNHRALAGKVLCGFCAQQLTANPQPQKYVDGTIRTLEHWRNDRTTESSWCDHKLLSIRTEIADAYLDKILSPLLQAEIRERSLANQNSELMNAQAVIHKKLSEAENEYRNVLPTYVGHISPELLGLKEQELKKRISDLKLALKDTDTRVRDFSQCAKFLENIETVHPALRKDAYRECLVWMALVPITAIDESKVSPTCEGFKDLARALFLTSWGTYHCATIYRTGKDGEYHRNTGLMRPSTPSEILEGVWELPNPELFVAGLKRVYHGRHLECHIADVAPGFQPGQPFPVATFDVTETPNAD